MHHNATLETTRLEGAGVPLRFGEGFEPAWYSMPIEASEFVQFEAAFWTYMDRRDEVYEAIPNTADWPKFLPSREKVLEYYLTLKVLRLSPGQIYMDVASCTSLFPSFLAERMGVHVIRQDLFYPSGFQPVLSRSPQHRQPWSPEPVNMWMLGCDGAKMPLVDQSLDAIALHCSFEHFEGDSDGRFVREALRVLKPGGRLFIVPFYCGGEHTEFVAGDQVTGCQFQRYYSPQSFVDRVLRPLDIAHRVEMYHFPNHKEVDQSFYACFGALLTRE